MNIGVNFMREHMPLDCRVHYAFRDVGGTAPNVVQETACLHYFVRAPRVKTAMWLTERVHNIARGAALMSETRVEMNISEALCDFVPNDVLSQLLHDCFVCIGGPQFDEADYALAKQFEFSQEEKEASLASIATASSDACAKKVEDCILMRDVLPYSKSKIAKPGSTDVGDVSYCTPTRADQRRLLGDWNAGAFLAGHFAERIVHHPQGIVGGGQSIGTGGHMRFA